MNLVTARYGSDTGPEGLYPCPGPVRTPRNAYHPGHGQRSALYSRQIADDQGRAAHPRAVRRRRRFHRPCLRLHIPARPPVHPPHTGPAVEAAARPRARARSATPDRIGRRQNPGGCDGGEPARRAAGCCRPGQSYPSAEPVAAKVRSPSPQHELGRRSPGNRRVGRTLFMVDWLPDADTALYRWTMGCPAMRPE